MTYTVAKRHGTMQIVDGEGACVYCPPSFIKLPCRQPMADLAQAFQAKGGRCIQAIMDFESRLNPRNGKARKI